ncbi:translation initiation factor IF-3 [Desulfovibrio mangrovi]|uniref:translation initiation factor IF-3 n=1 Tax=Desulfovibrio mangrovi TaxID=2976983 RepID=UPI0022464D84|nr:translation initiation factor IF-3 [Desulfovibrio mangrovi]UZP68985.1 translation initiation factor IF-3 [Desulfovibrio mangrovi]
MTRRNEQIRAREVRVIDDQGEQLGIMSRNAAIDLAKERGYDLVEVAANAEPPVCKIMDYGKFKFEQSKKKQEAKRNATVVQIKEIKVRPKTDEHDYQTKLKHIRRFLEDGDRCKVTVFFRGREIVHKDRGQIILERVVEDTRDIAKVEQPPSAEGRTLQMLLVPLPKK